MTDTNPSPDTGAEARIVVTTPEDVTTKALNSAAEQANALDLDATPSEEPEEPSEPSAEETGEEPDEKKGKPPKGVQKRLDELTREKYDQQRRAEAAEARLQQALGLIEKGPQQPQTFDPSGPPNPANYPEGELDINFFRDLAKYEVRQEIQAAKQEAVHQKTVNEIESREEAARSKYSDYNDVVSPQNLGPLLQNQDVFQTLASHEQGPELAYYLGKNPDQVVAIAQMSPYQAAMRIGQLLASITPEAPTKTASKAPPPISPIRGSGASPTVNYEARMQEAEDAGNFDLWRKLKSARDSGK